MTDNKRKKPLNIGIIIIYIILITGILITIFPFLWMILTSLKTQSESIRIPIQILPATPKWGNYIKVFNEVPFGRMYLNSTINAIIIVFGQISICSMAAYAFARIEFPGRKVIFGVLLSVLMIPASFFILPQYQIIQKLHLLNTLTALFLPSLFSIFGTFLLRQFFIALPKELEDAARIDGCSRFAIFTRIMLPLVKPGLVALGILTLRYAWNALMWPLTVNTETTKMTLPVGISFLHGQYSTNYPLVMAGSVMAVLPLLIMFAIFQKQFIEGVALQGIKG